MPAAWIDRDDRDPGACPLGPVRDDETVARLLSAALWQNGQFTDAAFIKGEMLPPKKGEPNNTCGLRNGESLTRCTGVSDIELNQRSISQFAGKRFPSAGVATASVAEIRAIRLSDNPGDKLFWIYEDPNEIDIGHAVIRFNPEHKVRWALAKNELLKLFTKK